MQNPNELRVTAAATELAIAVYRATSTFPIDERFGLVAQMRRAAVSIGSNIYEGCNRGSNADLLRFLYIAMGSAGELQFQTSLAHRLGYLGDDSFASLAATVEQLKRMLGRLIGAVKRKMGR